MPSAKRSPKDKPSAKLYGFHTKPFVVSIQQKKRRFLGLSALSVRHEDRGSARLSESKPSFLCQSPNLIIYQQLVEKTIVEIRFLATRSPKTHNTHTHAHTHTTHHARAHTHQPNWLKPKGVVTRTEHLHCGRRIWGVETVEENFLFD